MVTAGIIVKEDIDHWIFREYLYDDDYYLYSSGDYVVILSNSSNIIDLNIKRLINNSPKIIRFVYHSAKGNMLLDFVEEEELIRHLIFVNNQCLEEFGIKLKPEDKYPHLNQVLDGILQIFFTISLSGINNKNQSFTTSSLASKEKGYFFDIYRLLMMPKLIFLVVYSPYLLYLLVAMIFESDSVDDLIALFYPFISISSIVLIVLGTIYRMLKNRRELYQYIYNNKLIQQLK